MLMSEFYYIILYCNIHTFVFSKAALDYVVHFKCVVALYTVCVCVCVRTRACVCVSNLWTYVKYIKHTNIATCIKHALKLHTYVLIH